MVEDFRIKYRIGRAKPTGTYEITRLKTRRAVTKFQMHYRTPSGDFTPEEWLTFIEREVISDNKENLLKQIEGYVRSYCAWLKTEADVHEYALDCVASHAYEYWDGFSLNKSLKPISTDSTGCQFVRGQLALF